MKEKQGEVQVGCLGRRRKVWRGLQVRVVEVPEPWMGVGALGIGLRCAWEDWGVWGKHVERSRDT